MTFESLKNNHWLVRGYTPATWILRRMNLSLGFKQPTDICTIFWGYFSTFAVWTIALAIAGITVWTGSNLISYIGWEIKLYSTYPPASFEDLWPGSTIVFFGSAIVAALAFLILIGLLIYSIGQCWDSSKSLLRFYARSMVAALGLLFSPVWVPVAVMFIVAALVAGLIIETITLIISLATQKVANSSPNILQILWATAYSLAKRFCIPVQPATQSA